MLTILTPRTAVTALCVSVGALVAACSHSEVSGPPKCSDKSAKAERLAQGCSDGKIVHPGNATRCTDGRTLYTVPGGYAWGYSGSKVNPGAVTTDELTKCLG
jgi:hypothetical protein